MSGRPRCVANVYLGTSDFAATVLAGLFDSPHRPALVVTPPDRPRGRGRRTSSPPVAELARELGIELHQTTSVNEPATREAILGAKPELACVCAFGQLIEAPLLDELEMLNVHPSDLPRWRGAAPIERAVMAGDERTAVCVMRLVEGLDSGPVALRRGVTIGQDETYGALAPRLAAHGAELLVRALDLHAEGLLAERFDEQAEEGVTYADKLAPEERRIDPSRCAIEEARRCRALTPHVGTWARLANGERLGIRAVRAVDGGPPGGEFGVSDGHVLVGCAVGALQIDELQPAGGRWMKVDAYVRGHGLPPPLA